MPFISLVLDMGDEVVEQHACPGEPLGVGKGGHGAAGQEDATACKQGKCGMMSNVAPFIISINLDDCIKYYNGYLSLHFGFGSHCCLSFNTLLLKLILECFFCGFQLRLGRSLHRSLGSSQFLLVLAVEVVSATDMVPPTERGRKVVGEGHVVEVMVVSTRPEGDDVL